MLIFLVCLQDDVGIRVDSDSDLCLEDQEFDRRRMTQPVSYHQPNLNYAINPCYQPNNTEIANRDEPYVILNLTAKR